jgi:hypothetical protein
MELLLDAGASASDTTDSVQTDGQTTVGRHGSSNTSEEIQDTLSMAVPVPVVVDNTGT